MAVADGAKHPVAIRIARPYSTEEAFLERELETLTRTSVLLVGAQARPQGVVLRFEVTLASGAALLRGEGRVVGYKQNAFGDEPGLTLRFTRLDPRSKALVDRAAALRDARVRGGSQSTPPSAPDSGETFPPASATAPPPEIVRSTPPPVDSRPSATSPASDGFHDEVTSKATSYDPEMLERLRAARRATEQPAAFEPSEAPSSPASTPLASRASTRPRASTPPMERPASARPSTPFAAAGGTERPATRTGALEAPANRAELLERLRARARELPPSRVGEILQASAAPRP